MSKFPESSCRCLVTSAVTRTQNAQQQTHLFMTAGLPSFSADSMTQEKHILDPVKTVKSGKRAIITISTESSRKYQVLSTKYQVSSTKYKVLSTTHGMVGMCMCVHMPPSGFMLACSERAQARGRAYVLLSRMESKRFRFDCLAQAAFLCRLPQLQPAHTHASQSGFVDNDVPRWQTDPKPIRVERNL